MKSQFIRSTLCTLLVASLLGACDDAHVATDRPDASALPDDSAVTPESLGLGDDWLEIESGLWTRVDADGEQSFLGVGEVGKLHVLAGLEALEDDLLRDLAQREREDTQAQIAELEDLIGELSTSSAPPAPDETALRCSATVNALADAYPVACGVGAKASASYSHCALTGTVWSYAQASCGYDTVTHQCGPKSGKPVSCSSQVSIVGPAACKSKSFAQIVAPGIDIYLWDENTTRGTCGSVPPPPQLPPQCLLWPNTQCQPQ